MRLASTARLSAAPLALCLVLLAARSFANPGPVTTYSAEMIGSVSIDDTHLSYIMNGYELKGVVHPQETVGNVSYTSKRIGPLLFLTVGARTWLALRSSFMMYLIDPTSGFYFRGVTGSGRNVEDIWVPVKCEATSYLKENGIAYEPSNLSVLGLDHPWAVHGSGYHEKLFLEWDVDIGVLIIVNGFVSYRRPFLYLDNSRAKTLMATDDAGNKYPIQLIDTADPQMVLLTAPTKKITLELIEVYKGNKYNDTCISLINGTPSVDTFPR